MMGVGRAHVLVLVMGGSLLVGASTAGAGGAPTVHCGSTLVRSTMLTADLVGCPGTGLVIGADRITIDLAGHTISGTNAPGSEGIANDGHAGVRIQGGRISDFRVDGVGIRGGQGSVVRGLTIRRIGAGGQEGEPVSAGIAITDSPGIQVVSNDVSNDVSAYQSDGLDVQGSPGALVSANRLSHNNWNGLTLLGSSGSRVMGNQLDANGNNGTEINGGSDDALVAANHADGNTSVGIVLGASSGARVVGNTSTGQQAGFYLFDLHDSLISANGATGDGAGLVLSGGQFGSDGNRLIGNTASRNSSSGISLVGGADDNVLAGNVASENQGPVGAGGGIFVEASIGNQLVANVASGNLDSGIVFAEDAPGDTAGNSLRRNVANRNQGHGIEAVPGTVDAGGNRASGNVAEPQCDNVACSS